MNETAAQSADQAIPAPTPPASGTDSQNVLGTAVWYRLKNCGSGLFLDDAGGTPGGLAILSDENPDPNYPNLMWSATSVPGTDYHFWLISGHDLALAPALPANAEGVAVVLQIRDSSQKTQVWHLVNTERGFLIQSDSEETVLEDVFGTPMLMPAVAPESSPEYLHQNWILS